MLSYTEQKRVKRYEETIEDNNIEILKKIPLTETIILYVLDYPNAPAAGWAFYPKSGCQDMVSIMGNEWKGTDTVEEFTERCIDRLLDKHDWFDPEVKKMIEARGRVSKQK